MDNYVDEVASFHLSIVERHIKTEGLFEGKKKYCGGSSSSTLNLQFFLKLIYVENDWHLYMYIVFTETVIQLLLRKDAWYGFDVFICSKMTRKKKKKAMRYDLSSYAPELDLKSLRRILKKYLYKNKKLIFRKVAVLESIILLKMVFSS